MLRRPLPSPVSRPLLDLPEIDRPGETGPLAPAATGSLAQVRVGLGGLALAAGFSPVLVDLGRHAAAHPWARYGVLFAVLFAASAWRSPRVTASRLGLVAVALGLLVEVVAVGGGVVRAARVGLGLALAGGCRGLGIAPLPVALLGLFAIPLPHQLLTAASPYAEGFWERALAAPLGAPDLAIQPADSGAIPVVVLAGLGWYAAAVRGAGAGGALRAAARWAPWGLAAHAATVALAAAVAAHAAGERPPRLVLDHAWVAIATAGLWVAHRRRRRSARSEAVA